MGKDWDKQSSTYRGMIWGLQRFPIIQVRTYVHCATHPHPLYGIVWYGLELNVATGCVDGNTVEVCGGWLAAASDRDAVTRQTLAGLCVHLPKNPI